MATFAIRTTPLSQSLLLRLNFISPLSDYHYYYDHTHHHHLNQPYLYHHYCTTTTTTRTPTITTRITATATTNTQTTDTNNSCLCLLFADPKVEVIYICPVEINEEVYQYYSKLLAMKARPLSSKQKSSEEEDDIENRYKIIVPDAVHSFPVSIGWANLRVCGMWGGGVRVVKFLHKLRQFRASYLGSILSRGLKAHLTLYSLCFVRDVYYISDPQPLFVFHSDVQPSNHQKVG